MGGCCASRTIDANIQTCMDIQEIICVMKFFYDDYNDEMKEIHGYFGISDDIKVVKEIKDKLGKNERKPIERENLKVIYSLLIFLEIK